MLFPIVSIVKCEQVNVTMMKHPIILGRDSFHTDCLCDNLHIILSLE